MRSRCKDSSDFRPQAFPYGHRRPHKYSCAFTYRSQQKVRIQSTVIITSSLMKSPTTGQWWSRETHSEIRSCFLSDWGWTHTQRAALLSLTTWQTEKKHGVYHLKRRHACKCWTRKILPVLHNYYCVSLHSHTWNIYMQLKSQRLHFPPALYFLHPD